MASGLSIGIAFVAGLVSFLSPCVLPIIPGFIAYLAGDSGQEGGPSRWATFRSSLFFVLGFSSMFAILGVLLNTVLEAVAYDVQLWLARIGGVIVIFFGLYLTGLIKIKFLDRPHAFRVTHKFNSRNITAFVFGAAFAAGWTPCVGAALGAILGLAAAQPGAAFTLLMVYALGLGMPFLIIGFFTGTASSLMTKFAGPAAVISKVFGAILIALGVLIFTGQLALIANFSILNSIL